MPRKLNTQQLIARRESLTYTLVNKEDLVDSDTEKEEAQASWQQVGLVMLTSLGFQILMACCVVANAVVIGFETDMPTAACWNCWEVAFLVIFSVEVCMRLLFYGPRSYFDWKVADFSWNVFDFLVVCAGLADKCLGAMYSTAGHGAMVASILRVGRIFRIVRFLKQLYMLAYGFALAALAVFWVTILMGTLLYVSSIMLVRMIRQMLPENEHREFLETKFSTIPRSMFTLFELMVNPYLDPYADVMAEHRMLAFFIICFVLFGSFGMIALLTGVIHESLFEKNKLKLEESRLEREAIRKKLIERCGEFFQEMKLNEHGEARREDLLQRLQLVNLMFKAQGFAFALHELETMVDFMDVDNSGTISLEEFVDAVVQMADGINPVFLELRYVSSLVRSRIERCEEAMSTLASSSNNITRRVEAQTKTCEAAFNAMVEHSKDVAVTQKLLVESVKTLSSFVRKSAERETQQVMVKSMREMQASIGAVFELQKESMREVRKKEPSQRSESPARRLFAGIKQTGFLPARTKSFHSEDWAIHDQDHLEYIQAMGSDGSNAVRASLSKESYDHVGDDAPSIGARQHSDASVLQDDHVFKVSTRRLSVAAEARQAASSLIKEVNQFKPPSRSGSPDWSPVKWVEGADDDQSPPTCRQPTSNPTPYNSVSSSLPTSQTPTPTSSWRDPRAQSSPLRRHVSFTGSQEFAFTTPSEEAQL